MARIGEFKLSREQHIKKFHKYRVLGTGSFPIDMLRYDRCWPSTSEDITRAFVEKGERVVYMTGIDAPTEGRWSSFSWQLY